MAKQPSSGQKNVARDKKIEQINIPPHSIEAEQAVIGGMLLTNTHWDAVAERIIADDFYTFEHRLIFQEIMNLIRQNQPVDLLTLDEALKNRGVSEEVGGFAYLAELSNNTPSAANIIAYADIVREKAILRELIGVSNRIAEMSYQTKGRDSKDILDEAEREVFAIAEKRTTSNEGPQNIIEILGKTIDKIETLSQS
ncbi:DnaB-like helicase N-terminal domain-containing protein, partial [Avibacterium paragallinarum]